MKTIILKGLPRSGTNLLEYTLKQNYDVDVRSASKHGIIDDASAPIVYITKHPISWIVSFYAYGKERPGALWLDAHDETIENFIENPIVLATGPQGMWFPTPMDVWNCMNSHYHNMLGYQISIERLNTVTLSRLAEQLGLKQTSDKLTITSLDMMTNALPGNDMHKKRHIPLDERYRDIIWYYARQELSYLYDYAKEDA